MCMSMFIFTIMCQVDQLTESLYCDGLVVAASKSLASSIYPMSKRFKFWFSKILTFCDNLELFY